MEQTRGSRASLLLGDWMGKFILGITQNHVQLRLQVGIGDRKMEAGLRGEKAGAGLTFHMAFHSLLNWA